MSAGNDTYDLVAIGGGTAGLVTAAISAGLGARTALVERDRLGGECLWTGCVPSKAMIGSARLARAFRRGRDFGLPEADPEVDGGAVLESVREVRARIQPHDDPQKFRDMGVDVIHGEARFRSAEELEVDGRPVRARRFVIATGTRPAIPPVEGLEEAGFFTHETAFEREDLPGSLIVLGGGPIGLELAQAYVRLGTPVTVVEMEDRILPREDTGMAGRLRSLLEAEGVRILTGHRAVRAGRAAQGGPDGGVALAVEGPDGTITLEAEDLLVATGRRPNLEALEPDRAGVDTAAEGVVVDDRLRTTARHILAAGDVTGGLLFTHVADHEARAAVRNALFPFPSKVRYDAVPWCIYTDPELARVGMTETEARAARGDGVRTFTFELAELDRAIVDRAAEGCVKLIADRKGRLLGGHVLAPAAGTIISEVAMAMRHGIGLREISALVHPYPTLSEGVRKAADLYVRSRLTPRTRGWLERYFSLARRLGL